MTTPATTYEIYCDGGARGNPGRGAAAFIVYKNKQSFHRGSIYLTHTTNNYAEYSAVLIALKWLIININKDNVLLKFYLDSQLVVNQINGSFKQKSDSLRNIFIEVIKLKNNYTNVDFIYIPRNKNNLADELVNKTIDENTLNFTS